MAAIIAASFASELQAAAIANRITKGKPIKVDSESRPFSAWLEKSCAKPVPLLHNREEVELMKRPDGEGQTWSGNVTLKTATEIHVHKILSYTGYNFFDNHLLVNDNLAQQGFTIAPNSQYGNGTPRFSGTKSEYIQLKNLVQDKIDGFMDRISYNKDLLIHRQGTNPTDPSGLMAILPLSMEGNIGDLSRSANPDVQHIVAAGAAGGSTASNIRPSATIGESGTLLDTINWALRQAKRYVVKSSLQQGSGWKVFAGEAALDKLAFEYRRQNITWNKDAAKGGAGGIDMVITDDDLKIGMMPVMWNPTQDAIDDLYPSDKQNGVSQLTVAFSGGGATRQGRAVAYVDAAGTVVGVVVVDPGAGYTSAPTVTIGNAGGGTGATFTANWYGAGGAATGKVIVDADDVRIGQLAGVTVTAPGSGYATTGAVTLNYSDCLYLLWQPSWVLGYRGKKGGSYSIPAEDPRARNVEHQYDSTEVLMNQFPRANAVIHIAD